MKQLKLKFEMSDEKVKKQFEKIFYKIDLNKWLSNLCSADYNDLFDPFKTRDFYSQDR